MSPFGCGGSGRWLFWPCWIWSAPPGLRSDGLASWSSRGRRPFSGSMNTWLFMPPEASLGSFCPVGLLRRRMVQSWTSRSDHSAGGGMDGASGFGDVGLRCKQHTPPPAILSLRPLILLVGKKLRRRRGSVRRAGASPDYHLTWPWRVHGWSVAPPCNDLYSLNHRPHASFAEGRSCTTPRLLQVVARGIRTARGRRRDHVASLCLLAHFSRYVAQPRVRWPHDDQCLCEHIEASDGRYVGHVPPDRGDAGGRRDRPSRVHRHWLRPCCRRAVSVATAASRH